jgi:DNA-binding SARP family transcriptional activator/tetratricopeptide (TPR) repeat protein
VAPDGGDDGGEMTDFRVLGPVEVWSQGRRVDTGQPRQRAVLAALLADAGRAVPVDTIIDRVWGETPPRGARPSLQAHITRLRQVLDQATTPAPLTFGAGCYLLDVDPLRVDLHRLRHLTAQARGAAGSRVELLREAVGLWRGEPLAGLDSPWVRQSRQAWRQEYVSAAVAWGRAEVEVRNPGAVIATLADLAAEHPLTEPLAEVLIRALAAAGRPAEALTHYETVRRHLSTELGTDPSAELQAVYRSVLHGSPPAEDGPPVPAHLPADVPGFTGRATHLARMNAALAGGLPERVAVFAVSGMAGVGKTALAVHWARTVADRFPDGQLYVNLRGFDPDGRVMDPSDAVRGFLDALGVAPDRVPSGLDAQVALYRSRLAGKRILVVLDNARDAEHARPLLPTAAGAVAVVTSRNRLTGLVAGEGARPLALDVLSADEARDLLRNRLGADRTDAEPAAVRDIVAACAHLPLALAITAARAQQTDFPLAALAAELVETGARLDALDTGDPALQVRAVFSWSYAALRPAAARLFRLLGLHPGPHVSTAAAAAVAGLGVPETRRLLAELANANLVLEHAPGRYACHDLLRAYAADLAAEHDTTDDRQTAVVRLLDHYVHTAYAADRLLYPARDPIDVPLSPPAAGVVALADHAQAMAWLDAEHAVLLAAARHAAAAGHDVHAWQLAWALDTYLYRRGHWHDRAAVWADAVHAAERFGDRNAVACAHRTLGRAYIGLGRHGDARARLHEALRLFVEAGNPGGQAYVQNSLAYLSAQTREYRTALSHTGQALQLYRAAENPRGQAIALSQFGWYHAMLGDHTEAIAFGEQALELHRKVGDRRGQADVLDTLGYAHDHLGRHAEAAGRYREALALVRDLGDRWAEAQILVHLGDAQKASGEVDAARAAWEDALAILAELDHADVQDVRAKLDDLPVTARRDAPGRV